MSAMPNATQKAVLVIVTALAALLTAGLIRATFTYDVELVSSPGGPVWAIAGRPFNVSCRVSGGEDDNISSFKWVGEEGDDLSQRQGGNVSVERGEGVRSLVLSFADPTPGDSGTYGCRAEYAGEHRLLLEVRIVFHGPAPLFEVMFENATVEEGESAEFHCFARGETPITYAWYNQTGDLVSLSSAENGSWLSIPEARPVHEGMYTCNANNSHGLVSKLYYLAVTPREGANDTDNDTVVVGDFRVLNVSARGVRLYVPLPGSSQFVQFRYKEQGEKEFVNRQYFRAPDHVYEVENLTPAGRYDFQFMADGTWSNVLRVTLLPDVPVIIIRRQEKGSLEMEWFLALDDRMRGTIDLHQIKYYTVSMRGGNEWVSSSCTITIEVPSCRGSSFLISGLQPSNYYVVEVRAHTESGYGGVARQKIYVSA